MLREPRGESYRQLIDAAIVDTARAYVILQGESIKSSGVARARELLQPERISERLVREWPGTTLLGSTPAPATLSEYRCSARLGASLKQLANGLYSWIYPDLPEDLGFVRADGSTWLGSISHEKDSFMELDSGEFSNLCSRYPVFKELLSDGE